jgi:hypothetical protein
MATLTALDKSVFPRQNIIDALTDELLKVARSEAQVRGIALPPDRPAILKAPVPMDSLTTVDALCVLDDILKFKLKEEVVRTGGYDSVEEALDHLVPRIQLAWDKRKARK